MKARIIMSKITIFTPTYNREDELTILYNSLLNQSCKDFNWLIVDDGSTDGTKDQIYKWQKDNNINIIYTYQDNSGKSIAMKKAIEIANDEWFICIDSDDYFTENAVQVMKNDINKGLNKGNIGFIYPQLMTNSLNYTWIPKSVFAIDIIDARALYGVNETAILFKIKYLRQIQIPKYRNENFLSEGVIYNQLINFGKFEVRNNAFYISEYRDSGLTKNIFRHWLKNPNGTICALTSRYYAAKKYSLFPRLKERIKAIMNLNAFCLELKIPIFDNTPSKLYSILLYLPSMIWRKIRFR